MTDHARPPEGVERCALLLRGRTGQVRQQKKCDRFLTDRQWWPRSGPCMIHRYVEDIYVGALDLFGHFPVCLTVAVAVLPDHAVACAHEMRTAGGLLTHKQAAELPAKHRVLLAIWCCVQTHEAAHHFAEGYQLRGRDERRL